MSLRPDEAKALYRKMVLIRAFEVRTTEIFAERMKVGDFPGALHSSEGQEAIAVGVCSQLRDDDYVFSTYRGHGHALAKGIPLNKVVDEVHGRATGASRGFGGSMHLFDPAVNFMGGNGIVGGGLPLALGTAYAAVKNGTDQVTAVFFGDGAQAEGTFHESVNTAAIKKWPVLYACENNLYAATTHVSNNSPLENIADRAKAYGIPGVVVDGNDLCNVMDATGEAVARARAGEGPTLLELKTYRHHPHCMVIPEHRPLVERKEWNAADPIPRFAARMIEEGVATQEEIDRMAAEEKARLEEAIEAMRKAPLPNPADVEGLLYAA